MGNVLSIIKCKDARTDGQLPRKRKRGARYWMSHIALSQRLAAQTPVSEKGTYKTLPARCSEAGRDKQTGDSPQAPCACKVSDAAEETTDAADDKTDENNKRAIDGTTISRTDIYIIETAYAANIVDGVPETSEIMNNIHEISNDIFDIYLPDTDELIMETNETISQPNVIANISQNANKTNTQPDQTTKNVKQSKPKDRDDPKPGPSKDSSNIPLNFPSLEKTVEVETVKRDVAKPTTQTSSRGSKETRKEARKTKVSEFKVPKNPYADYDHSAPTMKLKNSHVNKIPNVAKTETTKKITWKQKNPQNVSGQEFWATRTPMFEPPTNYLGDRLLERLGSVARMRKAWIIPQCRQIETLKLEESVYPGIIVKPSKRWQYSIETQTGSASHIPRRLGTKKSKSNNKTVNQSQAGQSKTPQTKMGQSTKKPVIRNGAGTSKAPATKLPLPQRNSHSYLSSPASKTHPSLPKR